MITRRIRCCISVGARSCCRLCRKEKIRILHFCSCTEDISSCSYCIRCQCIAHPCISCRLGRLHPRSSLWHRCDSHSGNSEGIGRCCMSHKGCTFPQSKRSPLCTTSANMGPRHSRCMYHLRIGNRIMGKLCFKTACLGDRRSIDLLCSEYSAGSWNPDIIREVAERHRIHFRSVYQSDRENFCMGRKFRSWDSESTCCSRIIGTIPFCITDHWDKSGSDKGLWGRWAGTIILYYKRESWSKGLSNVIMRRNGNIGGAALQARWVEQMPLC